MNFDLDVGIFLGFLCVNLSVGLFYSRGTSSAREYAIGNRDFTTGAITTTVIATCIGAGFFSASISESYRQGLYFIIPAFGEPIALIITGYFLVPRMVEFFGNMSVAETMSKIYGKYVGLATAVAGLLIATGIVALQFKVASSIMQIFFGLSSFYAVALSAAIVVVYSSFGGIKAVTFTDIIQFFTFGVILPLITIAIWKPSLGDPGQILQRISESPLFDLHQVLDMSSPRFLSALALLFFFVIPNCDVTYIQRIGMSKGVEQARKSFIVAGCVVILLLLVTCWTGVLLFAENPNLDPNTLLPHIIESYTYTGLKGLTAICIMAVIMSTADSYLNAASVLLTNDIIKPLKLEFISKGRELVLLRLVSLFIGIAAFFLACEAGSLFQLLLLTFGFYMPVVTVPLLLAIFGFRTSSKIVLLGMLAGILTILFWSMDSSNALIWSRFVGSVEGSEVAKKVFIEVNPVIPAMLANLIVVMVVYFLSGRPKGVVSPIHAEALRGIAQERSKRYNHTLQFIKNFSPLTFCKKNMPSHESSYLFLGLFSMASVFSTMYTVSDEMRANYSELLNIIYHSVLVLSSILLTYPVWSQKFKNESVLAVFWMIAVPYSLIFAPLLLVIMSKFGQFQLIVFLVNTVIMALVMRWQTYLIMIAITTFTTIEFFKWFTKIEHIAVQDIGSELKVMYIVLLVSSTIIAFLKPQQESAELADDKIDYLEDRLNDQRLELRKALDLKYEFMRNLQHEARTPITGITSMAQVIDESYDKLSEDKRRQAIHDIAMSAERLESYVNNLVDLSNLSNMRYNLNLKSIDLGELLKNKLDKVCKLYIPQKLKEAREFVLKIDPKIIAKCDEYYIGRTIENILINAIQYCAQGKIEITLCKTKNRVELSVRDEGIGIPEGDLKDIFGAFTTSAKTKTPAGGRGVGLALAKAVMDVHDGIIRVESDGKSWTRMELSLSI
jgi:Na+/proline symporter/signal transduction histidine kinase